MPTLLSSFMSWRARRHVIDPYRSAGELSISFLPDTSTYLVRDHVSLFAELSEDELLHWLREEARVPGSLYTHLTGKLTFSETRARDLEAAAKERASRPTSPLPSGSLQTKKYISGENSSPRLSLADLRARLSLKGP